MTRRAVLLDRDGVLNRRRLRLVRSVRDLVLLPGAAEAAARLSRAGFVVAIVTNQPWVSSGYIRREDHEAVMRAVELAIEAAGGRVAGSYAALDSSTTKPKPDMLLQAAREHGLDVSRSFMVGDNAKDMLAGRRAGCRTVLVDPRLRTRLQRAERLADLVCADLPEAARRILAEAPTPAPENSRSYES